MTLEELCKALEKSGTPPAAINALKALDQGDPEKAIGQLEQEHAGPRWKPPRVSPGTIQKARQILALGGWPPSKKDPKAPATGPEVVKLLEERRAAELAVLDAIETKKGGTAVRVEPKK